MSLDAPGNVKPRRYAIVAWLLNRMEHALRRYTNLEEMKWKWNAPTDADVSREA